MGEACGAEAALPLTSVAAEVGRAKVANGNGNGVIDFSPPLPPSHRFLLLCLPFQWDLSWRKKDTGREKAPMRSLGEEEEGSRLLFLPNFVMLQPDPR